MHDQSFIRALCWPSPIVDYASRVHPVACRKLQQVAHKKYFSGGILDYALARSHMRSMLCLNQKKWPHHGLISGDS